VADRDAAVRVRYFAAAADAAGRDEETLSVSTAGELRELLAERYGAPMQRVLARGSFLVDGVVTRDPARRIGALVDVLPPFTGG
jgi:molybdopterin converting factor small subunit